MVLSFFLYGAGTKRPIPWQYFEPARQAARRDRLENGIGFLRGAGSRFS
jgi:hypothetical protein